MQSPAAGERKGVMLDGWLANKKLRICPDNFRLARDSPAIANVTKQIMSTARYDTCP